MDRALRAFCLCLLAVLLIGSGRPVNAQELACSQFDAWIWAQSVFEQAEPAAATALDPDGNGIACDQLRSIYGFAPVLWTDEVPKGLVQGAVVGVVDGDTLEIMINRVVEPVRLYRANAPEWTSERQCGGEAALEFAKWALSFNDRGATVWLEKDVTDRDKYDRYLAYVWFEVDGLPYMLNEVLIRSGYAEDLDYGDRLYAAEFADAAAFAQRHQLGVWNLCGTFDQPVPKAPQAPTAAPTPQGSDSPPRSGCESSYPTFCIEPAWVIGDRDCNHISHRAFPVYPPDSHGFDGDHDGVGCELR